MPRTQLDRAALEAAHAHRINRPLSLDEMLADPIQKLIIENEARAFMARPVRFDAQKARCGEKD